MAKMAKSKDEKRSLFNVLIFNQTTGICEKRLMGLGLQ